MRRIPTMHLTYDGCPKYLASAMDCDNVDLEANTGT